MKKNNYEAELPAGYELKYHIDAKNKKTTAIYLILSLLPVLVIFAAALLLVIFVRGWDSRESAFSGIWLVFLVICVIICVYAVCHELVHGITYKILTGGKLTFGLKWNVAFCGVPDIYVYRSAAKAAVLMPFIIFNFVFAGLTVGMYFVSDVYFLAAAAILGFHIGGCVGDLHVTWLFDNKFKDGKSLMRDTGPEQSFYVYTGVENNNIAE